MLENSVALFFPLAAQSFNERGSIVGATPDRSSIALGESWPSAFHINDGDHPATRPYGRDELTLYACCKGHVVVQSFLARPVTLTAGVTQRAADDAKRFK